MSSAPTTRPPIHLPDMPFLNRLLDGGLPAGQLIGLVGPAGGGKTLLSLQLSFTLTSAGIRVLYLGLERANRLEERLDTLINGESAGTPDADEEQRRTDMWAQIRSHLSISEPQKRSHIDELESFISEFDSQPDLIVIDQLAQWIMGNDDPVEASKGTELQDNQRLRELMAGLPADPFPDCSATHQIRTRLIGDLSQGVCQVLTLAETDRLKRDLGYEVSPPLEQLMIENILTLRLRLLHAEQRYNDNVLNKPTTTAVGAYMDKHLSLAQNRFLRAIESLAKVRRLARNTPSLQINIAQEGGQQVNVQGEVSGRKDP